MSSKDMKKSITLVARHPRPVLTDDNKIFLRKRKSVAQRSQDTNRSSPSRPVRSCVEAEPRSLFLTPSPTISHAFPEKSLLPEDMSPSASMTIASKHDTAGSAANSPEVLSVSPLLDSSIRRFIVQESGTIGRFTLCEEKENLTSCALALFSETKRRCPSIVRAPESVPRLQDLRHALT